MSDCDVPTQERPKTPAAGHSGTGEPISAWTRRLVVVGMVAAALNLRPAITSLGALLEDVRDDLHMSGTVAGLLTSVPVLCFAVFGVAAPRLARRFGAGAVLCAAMCAIAAGLLLRSFAGSTPVFLATSALGLAGIAVSNVLMPVIVKQYFPDRIGQMTGLYSMALLFGTAAAAAATVPIAGAFGGSWRLGLGVWSALAAMAVVPWLGLIRNRADASPASPAHPPREREVRITRSPTAWALACYFGLQATASYITMGWLPLIFRDAGVSPGTSGALLGVTMIIGVPLSVVLPAVAGRMRHQGGLVLVLAAFGLGAYAGLWLAPGTVPLVWALMLGVANSSFPLALTMIGMRSRSGSGVVRLSAFAQSAGYLLSIPGPILVGMLYERSGGWGLPIALMTGLMVPQVIAGLLAGRCRHMEDDLAACSGR
ncbi:CynX/NimT family MFS transporter [Streptomyces erythrochromogenes]|uniref:CynX/NimT family MFS transporter n=1 Tax=Streptomyces erythrochromogenes TaxID=285574 RepID=UPI00368C3AB6